MGLKIDPEAVSVPGIALPEGVRYRCIVADPPWEQEMVGEWKRERNDRPKMLPYETMTWDEIAALPIENLATDDCHLWLWASNRSLPYAFTILRAWRFQYLTTITWVKPSGLGAWFANTTQHVLFAYRKKCVFPQARYLPTHFHAVPGKHSQKPDEFYRLVRQISPEPRIDLFNRREITGFEGWGKEAPTQQKLFIG